MPISADSAVKTFLFFALSCEAKPFIAHYGFKKNLAQHVFEIYHAHDMVLTITGVGKSAMAAGVAYSLALFRGTQVPVLVNIGIAGHQQAELGQLYIVEKITDADSAKRYYPPCLPKSSINSMPLVTGSQPQTGYAPDTLYDMEAAAFYETATRFSSGELVLVVKVVSDNEQSATENINAKQVSAWLSQRLLAIADLIEQFKQRTSLLSYPGSNALAAITCDLHFTASEQQQLKQLLLRWQVLTENATLPLSLSKLPSARLFLQELKALIQQLPVVL